MPPSEVSLKVIIKKNEEYQREVAWYTKRGNRDYGKTQNWNAENTMDKYGTQMWNAVLADDKVAMFLLWVLRY